MAFLAGEEAWGNYTKSMISLRESAKGGGHEDALIHEQFHKTSIGNLPLSERKKMYNEARKTYEGLEDFTDTEVEEFLANMMVSYYHQRGKYTISEKLGRLFQRILRPMGLISRDFTTIENFFRRVHTGYYGNSTKYDDGKSYNMQNGLLLKYFHTADNFLEARDIFIDYFMRFNNRKELHRYLNNDGDIKEGDEGYVPLSGLTSLTFNESIHAAHMQFKEDAKALKPMRDSANEALYMAEEAGGAAAISDAKNNYDFLEREYQITAVIVQETAFQFLATTIYPVTSASVDLELTSAKTMRIEKTYQELIEQGVSETEAYSMIDEIRSKEIVDIATDTTAQVKVLLSNIYVEPNTYKGEVTREGYVVPYDKAYAIAIDMLKNLEVDARIGHVLEYLRKAAEDNLGDPDANAVARHIMAQFLRIEDNPLAKDFQFFNDDIILLDTLHAETEDNFKLRNLSLAQANKSGRVNVYVKRENENQITFFERVIKEAAQEGFTLDNDTLNVQYELWKSYDFVADLAYTLQSLEDITFLIGT